jgi:hypothetical protein
MMGRECLVVEMWMGDANGYVMIEGRVVPFS